MSGFIETFAQIWSLFFGRGDKWWAWGCFVVFCAIWFLLQVRFSAMWVEAFAVVFVFAVLSAFGVGLRRWWKQPKHD